MRNRYPGMCYRCKRPVAAGDGHFERIRSEHRKPGDPKWLLQHAVCAVEFRGTDVGRNTPPPASGEEG